MIINREEVLKIIEEGKKYTREEISLILNKARNLEQLSYLEISKLLHLDEDDLLNEMYKIAGEIKKKIYGNRVVLFAPLYISDYCVNNCVYCGYKHNNKFPRRKLNDEEITKEVKILEEMGHKRLALEAGEDPINCSIDYILHAIDVIYDTYNKNGKIRRININIAATSVENYKKIKDKGIGTYILFQETYDEKSYMKMHPNCLKANYDYHLNAFDRAMEAGIEDVGAGVLFGLSDPFFEVISLIMHNRHLENKFKVGFHTISVPRLRPAEGVNLDTFPYLLSDKLFVKLVTIIRLAVPHVGMILSTREDQDMRKKLLHYGISQISAGSCTGVGGYEQHIKGLSKPQFKLQDERSPKQVISDLIDDGYIPSYCTACYRTNRVGEKFMSYAKSGKINSMCNVNALTTLLEYGLDYGDNDLYQKIENLCFLEINKLEDEYFKKALIKNIEKLKKGKRDLYI